MFDTSLLNKYGLMFNAITKKRHLEGQILKVMVVERTKQFTPDIIYEKAITEWQCMDKLSNNLGV